MITLDHVARSLVTLALVAGFVWAVAVWRSRQRAAALVAVACALLLAVRLIWIPLVGLVFGRVTWSTGLVARFFILTGAALGQVALAITLFLLLYAALATTDRKQ
ncbi:MAG TPA: hypothetical protein VMH22_12810 [bacterium]|nr:hypothetical protein [bacterium]